MTTKELTQGNPLKLIILFMLPMFIGNVFQQIYNFVDALVVGRVIGLSALAAVGATTPLIFLVISFIFASTQGFTIVTAQKFGARDYTLMRKSVAASFVLSGILTIILTLISAPFSYSLLEFLRTPKDIIMDASSYLFIMFVGIFATVYYNLSSNIIRALGDSKTPLYFLIFSSFMNIFMDLLFVLKFKWGIEGVGWATVVAQAISTIMCLIYMFIKFPILKLTKEDWQIPKSFYAEHLRIGIPMGFQMSILSLGIIAVQYVLNGLGSIAIAAFTTAVRVDQLFSQTFLALGAAIATYTAQNYGANKISRIKEGAKSAVSITVVVSIICAFILYFFGKPIIGVFMSEPNEQVLALGQEYLNVVMVSFVFLGLLFVFRNILQGMGSVIVPLLSGVAELVMRVLAAFILGHYLGYFGICLATPAAWISAAIVLYIGYKISLHKIKRQSA